ncbi:hypothetical protein [Nocardioides marmotae]|uniref:hypothetical protein n=1 Tax=Nocardioides marmotae TaxID=2663857 RepID=UPI0012B54CD0|nr:hypothetical protein [Nocardioides marmotae]MBC9735402.1 hypothetical protein [Nocardioides marmotae]MTB86499.1 hypothetical protein [Nocardioides marmotae]
MRPSRPARAALAGLLAGSLLLTACSDDSDHPSAEGSGSPTSSAGTASASATPYLPVPEGVELTPQGSELEVGETATVAYEPRQDQVGVLSIRVDRIEKTSFKESFRGWQLDAATKKANPYFVRVTVANEGETNLGGRRVPLYIVDGRNTLVESSSFASRFDPCPSTPLPKKFGPGKKTKVCLVYLAPDKGELTAVSFRPTQEFAPITWTGPVEKVKKPGSGKKGKGKGGKNRKQG